ncbi:MAG: UDP-3-O-(3-hydroxymyristoyl)glucosamine N-acyltransferase [Phycisphaerales bacterium]|nr:UDP-3-O-(3-hydroxymyristoyl)glucosamine N-acyltransferase [Phycisphaerales bacterium]
MSMTLDQLAERLGATVHGDGSRTVSSCAPIEEAGSQDITFLANKRYARYLKSTSAAGVLIAPDVACPEHLTRLVCDDPYFAFRNAMVELHGFRTHPEPLDADTKHVSAQAAVHPEAVIGDDTRVHPLATVERGVRIGARSHIYPGVVLCENVTIGDDCILYPNVTVYEGCSLGDRVTIHANSVIGQDGFGYATHAGAHHKIPQAGNVVIEDDVEIGGACAIERATMGTTRIGKGTKLADLISIGHGTTLGEHCLLVSLVGIAGSVNVGNYVVFGGQTGVSGHITIGDGVQALAQSGIAGDVDAGTTVGGVPAIDADTAKRNALAGTQLHALFKRVKKLERQAAPDDSAN